MRVFGVQFRGFSNAVAMMVKKDALREQFSDICVNNLNDDILNKCVELCEEHELDEEELVETWTAFSAMHLGFTAPTVDTLLRMERDMLQKSKQSLRKQPSPYDSQKKSNGAKNTVNLGLPTGYTTPQRTKPESRLLHTAVGNDGDASPAIFSPASYSPAILTPSSKPASSGSGKVTCEFGVCSELEWKAKDEFSLTVDSLPTGPEVLDKAQSYMFEPVHISRAVLCDRVEQFGAELVKKYELPEISPLNEAAMEEVTVVGRVACDADDNKLTANSVVLVGASEKDEVQVNLSKVPSYTLFPGQVVALRALNPSGNNILASQIYSNLTPPCPQQPITFKCDQESMQVVIASGPFTHSDAMTYEPLHALVQYVKIHKPHVLILIGPFIDENHQSIQKGILEVTFETFFNDLIQQLLQPIQSLHTQVVLVSSARDAHHHAVYPTPPYTMLNQAKKLMNLKMVSDPCLLSINGVIFGVTSTDVLMHLGRCEVASQGSDRLARLASHVIHQATFYPLYPSPPQLSLHLELWEKYAQLPVKPHVLVLPSDLRSFIKEVEGSVIVNPERLTKGVGGGSFARIEILAPQEGKSFHKTVAAQVVKI